MRENCRVYANLLAVISTTVQSYRDIRIYYLRNPTFLSWIPKVSSKLIFRDISTSQTSKASIIWEQRKKNVYSESQKSRPN